MGERQYRHRSLERGSSLVGVLVTLIGLLSVTLAGLVAARSGLRMSTNYRTGLQAQLAAEAGALHAQKLINDMGVVSFQGDVVDDWAEVFGTGSRSIPGYTQISYAVTPTIDATNPSAFVLLTSVGATSDESERTVQVRLTRDGAFSPGAIYLPNPDVATTFNGNSFLVDGNDRNLDGTLASEPPVPGIATATNDADDSVTSAITGQQVDNVIGTAGTPSVAMAGGPSMDRLLDEIIPDILSRPGVVTNPVLNGSDVFGTVASPQITHFTGSVTVNGNLSGAGILIVDQGLTISGSSSFTGLIVVRGTTQITAVQGSTTILGALWTTDLNLSVAGSASVTYSSQALAMANAIVPSADLLPQRVRAVAWNEM